MADNHPTPSETKLTPEKRAAQWSPEWAPGKPTPVNRGALGFLIVAVVLVVAVVIFSIAGQRQPTMKTDDAMPSLFDANRATTTAPNKELQILQEQKTASENLTRQAVELIKANRMSDVRQLYKTRWNELATVRANVALDHDLTVAQKQNIDRALREDQEAITAVLDKYDRAYGP
jgi:hypothetical protein